MENKKRKFCELKGCKFEKNYKVPSQPSSQLLICNCCKGTYCSEECIIEHTIQIEKEKNTNADIVKKSLFIKAGRIVTESNQITNKYFSFENFEKVKLQNNKTKVLGTGAFGEVYQIKSKIDGKLFAMKQLDKSRMESVGIKTEVIHREINIHMSLIHDHIVRLFSFHEDHKAFYLIIEYVENGTLFSVIQKNKGLSEDNAFKYFIQVASAMYFLHENSLIHRDLKPENCLIDKDGNVKLCDFGWTVDTSHGERATFCGTYEYMAPEIIREKPYSKSIDVWSLGVLLYELIHSYSPFRLKKNQIAQPEQADPSLEVLKNILKHHYTIDKDVSESCKELLKDLLNPQDDARIVIEAVFKHPWVIAYENRIKSSIKFDEKTSPIKVKKENDMNDSCRNPFNPKPNFKNNLKNNSLELNSTMLKDFTGQNYNNNKDYLLDDILEQLELKNKKNRPKDVIKYNFSIDNINKTIEEEKKIVNKKIDDENKTSIRNGMPSPIRAKEDEFSMLSIYKDMNDIDKEISDKSKKIEKLEKKKNKIKTKIQNSSQIFLDFNKEKYQSLVAGEITNTNYLDSEKTQPNTMMNSEYYNSIQTLSKVNKGKEEVFSRESHNLYGYSSKINEDLALTKRRPKVDCVGEIYRKNSKMLKTTKTKNLKQINQELEEVADRNRLNFSHDSIEVSQTMKAPFYNKSEMSVQTESETSKWAKFWDLFNIKCG